MGSRILVLTYSLLEMPMTRRNAALKAINEKKTTRSTVARAQELNPSVENGQVAKVSLQGRPFWRINKVYLVTLSV